MSGGGGNVSFQSAPSYYVAGLLPSEEYRWNNNAPGTPLSLTYGFMTVMPSYANPSSGNWFGNEFGEFQSLSGSQREGVERAIQNYENVCNVDFTFLANGDAAQVRFGNALLDAGSAAHAYYPEQSDNGDWEGDVWFNTTETYLHNQSSGSYGYFVSLHEIGHTLGLKHPHDDGTTLPYGQDNRQYTVMSYDAHPNMPGIEPSTLLLYDIAALQYLYGANTSYKSGNDSWRWLANESFIACIWDGAGNDTLDASNQTRRVILDLNPGTFSSLGSINGGDAVNNVAIAFDCWIEDAIGGSGSDTITGNQLANRLDGGSGNDSIFGGAGNDFLIGGTGGDVLNGGADIDTVFYADSTSAVSINLSTGSAAGGYAGGDTLISIENAIGSKYNDTIVGDSHDNTLTGGAGSDVLNGGAGFDIVSYQTTNGENYYNGVYINLATGVTGRDATGDQLVSIEGVYGSWGDDTLIGDSGANRLSGAFGKDTLDGGAGADVLDGGDGDLDMADYSASGAAIYVNMATGATTGGFAAGDTLIAIEVVSGSRFDDVIIGNAEANRLEGNDGNDTLDGGAGADQMAGGAGDDLFFVDNENDSVFGGEGYDEIRASSNRGGTGHTGEKLVFVGTGDFVGWGDIQDDLIIGGAWNDTLHGGSGKDKLIGGAGNDVLFGDYDVDLLDGGDGIDWAGYMGTVTIDLVTGERTLDAVGDTYISIEGILASGDLRGDNGANWFKGFSGNDRFDGRGGTDTVVYRGSASDYDVTIVGGNKIVTPKRSSLLAQEGIDTLVNIENIEFENSVVNHAPSIWFANVIVPRVASSVFWFLRGTDVDNDSIVRYEIRDRTAGVGYFTIANVVQPANQAFTVEAADLVDLYFTGGIGADSFDVRAFDGVNWGEWTTKSFVATNQAPTVTGHSQTSSHSNYRHAASSLFSVSDPNGDPITRYSFSFEIAYNAGGNGYFTLNGVKQGTYFEVDAADLTNVEFVASTVLGQHNALVIRAYDGYDWSASGRLDVSEIVNAAPSVSRSAQTAPRAGTSVSAASLISVTDPDGDAITRYRFFDGTGGNGRFFLNGTPQAEIANFEIAATQLANLQFNLGAGGTSDTVWAQVYDGFVWSAWTSFAVTAAQNNAPAAAVSDRTPARGTTSIAAANLVTPSDPDGDAITQYKFFDGTTGNGYFRKNGVTQAEQTNISVTAAELASTQFVLGAGSDVLWVQVYDGMAWSAWKTFTVNPPQNTAPVVSVNSGSLNPGRGIASVAASVFFTVSDADNDTITQYRFFDGTAGNGTFTRSGVPQTQLVNLDVAAADLANFRYQVSTTGVGDTLWVQAFDGFTWSAWRSFNVAAPVNNAPVVSVSNLTPARGTTALAAASLFSVADADGDVMTQYRFFDGTSGSGYFRKGATQQAELTNITVNAADLATTQFVLGGASDVLWVQAFDGTAWSAWQSFTVAPPVNNAPVVTVSNLTPGRTVTSIAGSALQSVSDADGDAITQYRFFDGTIGNGRFFLSNAPQDEQQNITINAADLANFSYRTSTTGAGDTLWVQASDGTSWGTWKSFTVAAPQNNAPVVTVGNRQAPANTAIAASTLFTVSDADADPITRYQFWDSTQGGGAFRINGVAQAVNANIDVMANQLAATDFLSGSTAGTDQLWARASDGTSWGEWKTFNVTTLASS